MKEREKLESYNTAISSLPQEEQIRKMRAVTSPVTLKRFLSEESPASLVHRFAHRVKEVMKDAEMKESMSSYEKGRIHAARGKTGEAIKEYEKACEEGDLRATAEVIELLSAGKDFSKSYEYTKKIMEYAEDNEEICHAIGTYNMNAGYPDIAKGWFKFACEAGEKENFYRQEKKIDDRDNNTNRKARYYYRGMDLKLNNNFEIAVTFLKEAAQLGDERAMSQLVEYYREIGYMTALKETYEMLIKRGYIRYLIDLGEIYLAENNTKKAEDCFFNAVRTGNKESFQKLVDILHGKRSEEIAEKALIYGAEAIRQLNFGACAAIIAVCAQKDRYKEAVLLCKEILAKDTKYFYFMYGVFKKTAEASSQYVAKKIVMEAVNCFGDDNMKCIVGGIADFLSEDPKSAEEKFAAAVKNGDDEALQWLALAQYTLGNKEGSKVTLQIAVNRGKQIQTNLLNAVFCSERTPMETPSDKLN